VTIRLLVTGLVALAAWSPIGGLSLWASVRLLERAGLGRLRTDRVYDYREALLTFLIAGTAGLGVALVVAERRLVASWSPASVCLVVSSYSSLILATTIHAVVPTPFRKACLVALVTVLLNGAAAAIVVGVGCAAAAW
jgi:hypothetical protein